MVIWGERLPEAICGGSWPEVMVRFQKTMDRSNVSAHDEINQLCGTSHMKIATDDCKRDLLKSFLLVSGLILTTIPLSIAKADQNNWEEIRNNFLEGEQEFLQLQCDRGAESNKKGLSTFNNDWVKETNKLRFNAGVAQLGPDGSNIFFSGLSMAMKSRCPGVW